jgi:PelA/Pel-15E family pectate lyase
MEERRSKFVVLFMAFIFSSGCLGDFENVETHDNDSESIPLNKNSNCEKKLFTAFNYSIKHSTVDICLNENPDLGSLLNPYRSIAVGNGQPDLNDATINPEEYGLNISTWQLDNGGWGKVGYEKYMVPWDGVEARSAYICNHASCEENELSTFDNNATTAEMRFLAYLFKHSSSEENKSIFKNSFQRGVSFILNSQNDSGGWPQVFPTRYGSGAYSNLGTFNDHVIVRNMLFLLDLVANKSLFDDSLILELNQSAINQSLLLGIDFILNTQIIVAGEPTIWAQQYDMNDLSPSGARSFELTGRSTWESAGVTSLLLNWPDRNTAVDRAIVGAIRWYDSNAIWNMSYVHGLPNQEGNGDILAQENEVMWYRLYNLSDDQFFLSSRDGVKIYDINILDNERRFGYQWGGDWGRDILTQVSIRYR